MVLSVSSGRCCETDVKLLHCVVGTPLQSSSRDELLLLMSIYVRNWAEMNVANC